MSVAQKITLLSHGYLLEQSNSNCSKNIIYFDRKTITLFHFSYFQEMGCKISKRNSDIDSCKLSVSPTEQLHLRNRGTGKKNIGNKVMTEKEAQGIVADCNVCTNALFKIIISSNLPSFVFLTISWRQHWRIPEVIFLIQYRIVSFCCIHPLFELLRRSQFNLHQLPPWNITLILFFKIFIYVKQLLRGCFLCMAVWRHTYI